MLVFFRIISARGAVDEFVVSTLGTRTLLGNAMGSQLRRSTIAGRPRVACQGLRNAVCPAHTRGGYAGYAGEYWAKVRAPRRASRPSAATSGATCPACSGSTFLAAATPTSSEAIG